MSNIIELSAFNGARSPKRVLASESVAPFEPRVTGRRCTGRRMVFRNYTLIVQSDEADLMRDVCFDIDKAQTKLEATRRQLQRDREHAAAREKLLTSAEDRLSAAIVAARSLTRTPAHLLEAKQPRTKSEALAHRREFKAAMRQRVRDIAALQDLSEEEIKPVLTLKHHEITKFTEKHGVNLEWLLEGKGRIFKKNSAEPPEITKSESTLCCKCSATRSYGRCNG